MKAAKRRYRLECDVQWEAGRLFVRRSHSLGEEVMRTTKQKTRYAIDLPLEAMDVLRGTSRLSSRHPSRKTQI